ncbi:MAG: Lrp/AsnC family transcriptional regulator [Nevskiales bacterium]
MHTFNMPVRRCDEIDRRLIRLLVKDVRATNRQLARETGLSEWSIANRLRRLRDDNLVAASLVVDWRLAAYHVSAFALIRLEGAQSAAVAKVLGARSNVQSVSHTLGSVDLIAHVLGEDLPKLRAMADEIGGIAGVASVEFLPIVEYHRYVFDRTPLPQARWSPREFAVTTIPLDELDHRLMNCLINDAHQSNREIARQLKVSENTIRTRLRQLEDSGMVRVIAMFDPFALGEAVISYFALRAPGKSRRRIVEYLSSRAEIPALVTCLGHYDVVGIALCDSLGAVARFLEALRGRQGVESLVHFPITGAPLHRFHLARLL